MPVLEQAEKLLERAGKGERLVSTERRHALAYKLSNDPETTNMDLARLFQVSEGLIRQDKDKIRKDLAKLISEDDRGFVIVDIKLNFDRQMRDLEAGKKKAKIGTDTYLRYCRAIFELEEKRVRLLQDIGYYPKNLGTAVIERYDYKAIVNMTTGAVTTNAVDRFNKDGDDPIIDVEPEPPKLIASVVTQQS